jgi:hypothetical protein
MAPNAIQPADPSVSSEIVTEIEPIGLLDELIDSPGSHKIIPLCWHAPEHLVQLVTFISHEVVENEPSYLAPGSPCNRRGAACRPPNCILCPRCCVTRSGCAHAVDQHQDLEHDHFLFVITLAIVDGHRLP